MRIARTALMFLLLLTVLLGCVPQAEVGDNYDIGSVRAIAITKTLPEGLWRVTDDDTNITCMIYTQTSRGVAISCIGPEEG